MWNNRQQVCPRSTQVYICFPFALSSLGRNPPPFTPPPPKSPLCAAQEELVLAALRIEALQVAKNISQCPSLSTVTPQVLRWILRLVYASVCWCACVRGKMLERVIMQMCAWCACMSVFQPAPKHTILRVTVNSWPYQHGGCTTTSSVLPPLQSPHMISLTWLNAFSFPPPPPPPDLAASSPRLAPQKRCAFLVPCLYCACWATCMLPVHERLTWAWMWLGMSHTGINISSRGVMWIRICTDVFVDALPSSPKISVTFLFCDLVLFPD